MRRGLQVLAIVASLVGPLSAQAVTLVITPDGILTGARGVSVDGVLYDVDFRDGLCSTYYGDCGAGGNFGEMNAPPNPEMIRFADRASWALLDQVLTGAFDLDAGLTYGCNSSQLSAGRCYILTPYWWQSTILGTSSGMVYMAAVNGSVLPNDIYYPYPVFSNDDMVLSTANMGNRHPGGLTDGMYDPSTVSASVWAVWRPASVAEPGTLSLLGLGLAGLGLNRRRKAN